MENARMRSLSWDQVLVWRRRRHRLVEPAPADRLVQVAGAVCGIHAQVMATAELSLGLRVAGATRQDVRQELWERRGLVKTYGLPRHRAPVPRLRWGVAEVVDGDRRGGRARRAVLRPQPGQPRDLRAAGPVGLRLARGRRPPGAGEVLRRFLGAYGPVSPRDFAPWFLMKPEAAVDLAGSLPVLLVDGV